MLHIFVSFVRFGTLFVLNLFIGVSMPGTQEAQAARDVDETSGPGGAESRGGRWICANLCGRDCPAAPVPQSG